MGGLIALDLAIHYPELAKALIIGAATYRCSEEYYKFWKMLGFEQPGVVDLIRFEQVYPDFVKLVQQRHTTVYGIDYWKTLINQLSIPILKGFNYTKEELKKIIAPVLLLVGDRDLLYSVDVVLEMYHLIPNAELAVIPYADHMFIPVRPHMFTNPCLDFLLRHQGNKE